MRQGSSGAMPRRSRGAAVTALVAAGILALSLAGIAGAQTVIQHFHNPAHGTAWSGWIQERIEKFEAENPGIEIELIIPAASVSADQFLTLIASGTPIDVSELVLRLAASVAAQGVYRDLRPFLERSTRLDFNDNVPVAREAMTLPDGTVWGVPVDLYVVPTHFNADMFASRGLVFPSELGTDWTFDAALEAAKRLTVDRSGDGVPDEWGTQTAYTLWVYRNGLENRGAPLFDRVIQPTRSRMNAPDVAEALTWIAELHTVHNVAHIDSGAYSGAFPQGIYGWSLGTGPNTHAILRDAGTNFAWGVALPIGGVKQGAYAAVNSLQIPRTSQNTEAAWRWIEFLLGTEESWLTFIEATGRLPANQQVMPTWLDSIVRLPNAPIGAENYLASAMHPDNYLDILSPHYARFDALAQPIITDVLRGLRSPQAALEEIHQQMTVIFSEAESQP